MGNLISKRPIGCDYSGSCREDFISVGPVGDVYPCGRFDGEKEFWLGNVHKSGLLAALNSEAHQRMIAEKEKAKQRCSPCEYKTVCNSGCLHNAYTVRGDLKDKDPYCLSYRQVFSHVLPVIHKELAKAEVGA